MDSGCPVCNGFMSLSEICPDCGSPLADCGSIANYQDPYGPYEEQSPQIAGENAYTGDNECVHFLQCPNCDCHVSSNVTRDDI